MTNGKTRSENLMLISYYPVIEVSFEDANKYYTPISSVIAKVVDVSLILLKYLFVLKSSNL